MPMRLIKELENKRHRPWVNKPCVHRDHNPPNHIVIKHGETLEHECPACGKITIFKMNNITQDPILLFDSEDEIYQCWVEAIVDEEEARNLVAPFLCDENGDLPFTPVGPAEKQYLYPSDKYEEHWKVCDTRTDLAREFWSIMVY